MESVAKQFGKKLEELRKSVGTNQSDLAAELGVSRGAISYYENGDRTPDIEFLLKTSNFFNVSCDYLLGKDKCKTPENEEIKELLGLTDESIDRLKNAQKMKEKDCDLDDKLFVLNHIIKTMNTDNAPDTQNFLKNFYMYLFAGFGFPIPGDKEYFHDVTEIDYSRKGGKVWRTFLDARDIGELYFGKTVADMAKLRDEILNEDKAEQEKASKSTK